MKKLSFAILMLGSLVGPRWAFAAPIKYIQSSTSTQVGSVIHQSSGTVDQFTVIGATATTISLSQAANAANLAPRWTQVKTIGYASSSISAATTTTSATFGKTSLTASITPKSTSSKIKITTNFTGTTSNISFTCQYKITRNGATISLPTVLDYGGASVGTNSIVWLGTVMGEDSPASTSSQTYELSFRNLSGGITCGVGSGANSSTIYLEEINGL